MSNSSVGCNLVILDACRSTPVGRNPAERDANRGGGLVEMNPPAGSLIAFSTDAGRIAADGQGMNGIYTAELIKHLTTPGLTIEQVFKRTRAGVIAATEGAQMPAEYSRLVGDDIYLAGREPVKEPEPDAPKARPVPLPTASEINKLAARGEAAQCVALLRQHARGRSGLDAAVPLTALLDYVKEHLRNGKAPKGEAILQICDVVLESVGDLVATDHVTRTVVMAKAHNRRGDALLLLDKADQALEAYNTALSLTPNDGYVLYNRGMALLRLERTDEARADFTKVASAGTKQPGARKLANEALAAMK
jgi:Caspase domain/TPR repeat